jgi:hypothetical protein
MSGTPSPERSTPFCSVSGGKLIGASRMTERTPFRDAICQNVVPLRLFTTVGAFVGRKPRANFPRWIVTVEKSG